MRFTRNTRAFAFAACIAVSAWAGSTALAANLLFKSGFENGTTLGPIACCTHQLFSGTDTSTGFDWGSFPFNGTTPMQLHLEPYGSDPASSHFNNSLDTSTSHSGSQSLFLSIFGYSSGCCAQTVGQTSGMNPPLKQVYYRFWEKLPSSLSAFLANNTGFYTRTGISYKTADDYRIHLDFNTSGSVLHPHMHADAGGVNASNGSASACPYRDPITGAVTYNCSADYHDFVNIDNTSVSIPINQWFEIEVYFKRSVGNDGAYYAAINGQTLALTNQPDYGVDLEEIMDMYWFSLYNSGPQNGSEWIDDFEVWDAPPCGTFPCGQSNTTTSWTGPVAPFPTSRQGAVGEVGMPFSFQVTATGNPTNYYVSGSLPPGLSIDHMSGLISGTPTTAGTTKCYIEMTNSVGKGAQWMEFQINNPATAPPTISGFSASSSTINAGNWVQLTWTQSGATSLSIDQGIGDVTGADPYPVHPNATTTYTLTATNAAGVARASVTVNVNGTTPAKPIITSATSASGTVGTPFSYQIAATNSPKSYAASPLPAGLSVNSSTGLISGTPTATGTTNVALSASNSAGTGTAAVAITNGMGRGGSIAQVQANDNQGSGLTSISASFPVANTSGNMILVFVRASTATQTVNVADSVGNSYAQAVAQNQTADGHQVHFFYAKNIKPGSNTVTATFSAKNNHPYIAVYEYSGLSTSSPLDQIGAAQGFGANPSCGPTPATSSATELAVSGLGMLNNFSGSVTAGSGWTILKQNTSTSRAANESENLSTTGSVTGAFTLSAGTNWSCIVATFKP